MSRNDQSRPGLARRLRRAPGFTTIELLMVITIGGILLAVAVPSFRTFLYTQEVRTLSFDVMAALSFARSEAVKRNATVRVAANDATDWAKGWSVIATTPSGDETIRVQAAAKRAIITPTPGGTGTVTFSRTGRAPAAAGFTLQVDDQLSSSEVKPRCVSLSLTGQAVSKEGAC